MLPYIIIILATVIILGFIFGRKHGEETTDYKPQVFKHSGHEWVFNGILDIDHPLQDNALLVDYDRPLQMVVKKGYVHYDLEVAPDMSASDCGLFRAEARILDDGRVGICREDRVVAHLAQKPSALIESIHAHGGHADAYAFIASKGNPATFYGEACIAKT